jgi:hypothetical protein
VTGTGEDDLLDVYAGALIDCEVDGQTRRLRGPDAAPLPAAAPMFVFTAHNPAGAERDPALNEAAEHELEHELSSSSVTFWPATGRSPDASWSEPGVAVAGLDRTEACAYGRRYGQLAVYELTADEVRVVRCVDAEIVRSRPRHTSEIRLIP